MIDPAQVYLDRHRLDLDTERHPAHWKAAIYGPGVSGGSRAATETERAELAEEAIGHRDDYEAAIGDAKRRWARQLERAADELLTTGATEVRLGGRAVEGRIIEFWRGDHVLRAATRGPNGSGESLSRIKRDRRGERAEVLIDYLARAATKG